MKPKAAPCRLINQELSAVHFHRFRFSNIKPLIGSSR